MLKNSSRIQFVAATPVLPGLWAASSQLDFVSKSLRAINDYGQVNDAAHIYICIRQHCVLGEVWEDMEQYLSLHAEHHLKSKYMPTDFRLCYLKYQLR
jgi:hypothetical protein